MKCLKDTNKDCHSKVITPEYAELPACLRGPCSENSPRKARPLFLNPGPIGRRHIKNPIPTDEEWKQYHKYAARVHRRLEEAERKTEKPGRILIKNPTKSQLQSIADFFQHPVVIPMDLKKEAEVYETFHHQKPDNIISAKHPAIPRSLIALGKLESVVYKKYSDDQSYIHDLKHGILAADRKGKLYIIGDKAKITERGIVG